MAAVPEERTEQVILSCLQVPCERRLQIMISNTLLFLTLREDSVLYFQATPQNSLLWTAFNLLGSALPGCLSLCSVVAVPVKPKG